MAVMYNIVATHHARGDVESAKEVRGRIMQIAGISETELQHAIDVEMKKDKDN